MSRKALSWSTHALDSLDERKFLGEWVEQTVFEPDWCVPDPQHFDRERRFKAIPEFGNRIMRVVVVETATEIRIVTAFFDRKARRP